MTRRAIACALILAASGAACGSPPPPPAPVAPAPTPARSQIAAPTPAPKSTAASEGPTPEEIAASKAKVKAMLARVAEVRGLPVKREVGVRVLDREQILAKIREHVDKDTPLAVIDAQGEALAALELIPPEYDFVEGTYKLIQGRIAGFYEPEDQTMYLVDDLGDEEANETLAHELVHALQDQSYAIAPLLKYTPGESDRTVAVHALLEGDATSAMLDVAVGSADAISEAMFRRLLNASTTFSVEGLTTPHILQSSLTAPYADGFSFVQNRRHKGGWPAVDGAYRDLPTTTEQLLHADKFDAKEPAIPVGPLPLDALGKGFRVALDDVMGEQAYRLMLEEWTLGSTAAAAAAGWGGDRYVVARRDAPDGKGPHEIAVGFAVTFDTAKDAAELADVLKSHFGARCKERSALGPVTFKRSGREVAIAAGPFTRIDAPRGTKSAAGCATTEAWATALLKAAASRGAAQSR